MTQVERDNAAEVLGNMLSDIADNKLYGIKRDEINAILRSIVVLRDYDSKPAQPEQVSPTTQPDPETGLVPCDFCAGTFDQKPLLQENKYKPYTRMMSTISIEENNGKHQIEIDLWDGGNVYAAFEINYCPMCGRKLEEGV